MYRPTCYDPPSASSAVIPRAPDIESAQISNGNTRNHSRKRKRRCGDDLEDAEADIEGNTSTEEDFPRWKCPSCKDISTLLKKPCGCSAVKRKRLCTVSDCPKLSTGQQNNYMCWHHYRRHTSNEADNSQLVEADVEANVSTDTDGFRWRCSSCRLVSPLGEKSCGCGAKRRRLCAVPNCQKQAAGLRYNHMCKKHCDTISAERERQGGAERTTMWKCRGCGMIHPSDKKRCPPPCLCWKNGQRLQDIEDHVPSDAEEVDDQSEDEELQDVEADIEANMSTAEDVIRWICPSCKQISPLRKKPCGCAAIHRIRLCAVPDCLRASQGGKYNYMCAAHYRKYTTDEAVATPPNPRRQNTALSPGRLKNPYADRQRRNSPRKRSRHHCGTCDACMVDDCGECSCCLDKPRFGGPNVSKAKCINLPPCYNPPGASRTLDSDFAGAIERNVSSDEDEVDDESEDQSELGPNDGELLSVK